MAIHQLLKNYHPDFSRPKVVPNCPVQIDRSNPLAQHVYAVYIPVAGGLYEAVSGILYKSTDQSKLDINANRFGRKLDISATGQDFLIPSRTFAGDEEFSISWLASKDTANSLQGMICGHNGGTADYIWQSNTTSNVLFRRNAGTLTFSGITSITNASHVWRTITSSSGDYWYYAVGESDNVGGSAQPFDLNVLCNGYNTDSFCYVGDVQGIIIHNKVLSQSQANALHNDPWQILKPANDLFYFTSAGGGATYTLTAQAGSFTLTGANATLTATRNLTAQAGSFTLTGSNATLSKSYTLTANAGSFTLTGANATLTANRLLTAQQGSFTLTGADVNFTYNSGATYTLTAQAGSFALTGADITTTATRKLTAQAGSYSVSGSNVTFTYSGDDVDANSGGFNYDFLNPPTKREVKTAKTIQRIAKKQIERETKKGKPTPKTFQYSELKRALKKQQIELEEDHKKQLETARDQAIDDAIQQQLILQEIITNEKQRELEQEQEDIQIMLMMLSSL